ncbi:MAG: AsmA-like C-terminal domain-containing protein [Desulfobacteraceae bacterium]|nr:AsmA-like C-terminal domain-containing protein [Desulfobacteraceae bacterium]
MKDRSKKKIGIIFGIIAIVLILVVLIFPKLIDLNRYNGLIVSEVEKAVGGEVNLGRISWGISHGLWLEIDGFSILDASAFPGDVKLSRIYTNVSIPPLIKKKVVLNKLLLEGSEVKIRLEPGTTKDSKNRGSADEQTSEPKEKETKAGGKAQPGAPPSKANGTIDIGLPAASSKPAGFQLPVKIEIETLVIKVDRLEIDDALTIPGQTQVRVYRDVDIGATHIAPGEEMVFNLALRAGDTSDLGALRAQGSFSGLTDTLKIENPNLKLKAVITALPIDAVKSYLKNSLLEKQLVGSVSLEIHYEGDLIKNHHSKGVIDLSQITYTDPSLFEAALPGQKTTLIYQVKLDPYDLTVEKLGLKLGNLSLDAQADVHSWGKDPVIKSAEFSSDLPLVDLIPVIPWKLLGTHAGVIRKICEGGGNITLTKVVLPEIRLSKLPKDPARLLSKVKLTASLNDIMVPLPLSLPKIEGITGRVNFENDVLSADNVQAKIGPLSLPTINIRAANIADQPKVALRAKGPMQVVATSDANVEKILMKHGLKSLTGSAEIDMSADYDQVRPKNWTANGLLVLKGVRAEAHPASVVMDNLKGKIKFNRKKKNITAQDITARINQAPVRLSGEFFGIGTPKMLVSAKAYAKQLDLAALAELLPALKDFKLGGTLDMNLDVHVPYSTPTKSRLNGIVTARNAGFQVAASDLVVEKGNTEIELNGNTANIKTMTMLVNDQQIALSGHISNPVKPKAQLLISSSDLNLDRLLLQDKAGKPSSKPSKAEEGRMEKKPVPQEKIGETELPPLARKLTADLQVQADRGQYTGFKFQNLKLNLFYELGVIKNYDINFETDGGNITTKGSADLRNLDHIPFEVDPDINALPLEKVAPLLGIDNLPLNGPMSLKGRLRGRTGSSKELLAGLDGDLNAQIGPGSLNKIGKAGEFFAKILSTRHIREIFSGRMIEKFSSKGIPFKSIKAQTSFAKGTLNLNNLDFDSEAMNVNSQGTIDLINQELNIEAILVPFKTVDKALGFIPIVGRTAEDLTKMHIHIKGPLEDPKIHAAPIKGLVKDLAKEPVENLKDAGKNLKKRLYK